MKNIVHYILIAVLALFLIGCSSNIIPSKKEVLNNLYSIPPDVEKFYDVASEEFNKFSISQNINDFMNFMKTYIDEVNQSIPLLKKTGIIVDSVYLDSISGLIIEVNLENVDKQKLDRLISTAERKKQKLTNVLKLLSNVVDKAKSIKKIGGLSMDMNNVQLRLFPPATRLKYKVKI